MTIYILAGGNDRRYDEFGKKLADVIHQHIRRPKILSCEFARPEETWPERLEGWKEWFTKYLGNEIEVRSASRQNFLEEVKWANVIYLHGGSNDRLINTLNEYGNLEEYFEGKIIIGSSAGTNYLSKNFYSPEERKLRKGNGVVDIDTIVHYGALDDGEVPISKDDWKKFVDEMKSAVGDEKITFLSEGEFVVIEK